MCHLILIGFKHVGKSTIGRALATRLNKPFIDLDSEIEKHIAAMHQEQLSCRQILAKYGEDFFRTEEENILSKVLQSPIPAVIAVGGGTPLSKNNQQRLQQHKMILIEAEPNRVWDRITATGLPAYFSTTEDPFKQFQHLWQERKIIYHGLAQHVITNNTSIEQAVTELFNILHEK